MTTHSSILALTEEPGGLYEVTQMSDFSFFSLIGISLMISAVKHFSCASWLSVCLFRKKCIQGLLPDFNQVPCF